MFTAKLQRRDFTTYPIAPVTLTPVRWSWNAQGGPMDAEFGVEGDVWEALGLLRCPIVIRNQNQTPVWWGYVSSVQIGAGSVQIGVDLDSMANRVAVAYSLVAPGSVTVGGRATTAWTQDADSVSEYGTKDLLASVDGATATTAEAVRDALLTMHRYPIATPNAQSGKGGTLYARGWWSTLGWRYYAKATTASTVTTTQVANMVTSVGEFLTGTDVVTASGVSTSEYRDGDSTALDVAAGILRGSGLLGTVTVDRALRIEVEPVAGANDWLLQPSGEFQTRRGVVLEPGVSVLGWTAFRGVIPASAQFSYMTAPSPFFVEENEYTIKSNAYRWRARGVPSPWELARIT